MFKNKWSNRLTNGHLFTGRKSANYRPNQPAISHGHSKESQDFLSNIVEEGSTEDLPKTFEQEEQYMNDCLKSMGSSVEDVRGSEVEEYDFDDFNSIASTTSMLNLAADHDERLRVTSPPTAKPQIPRISQNGFKTTPTWNTAEQTNTLAAVHGNDRLSKSLSRVQNWDRLGRGGEHEDWGQVLLQAAEAGDLITVQDAVSHLGATKECLVTARDTAGNTPLHKAAQNGKLQCLKWLVKRAPRQAVTIGNHDDMTPAAMATQYGQCECLEWLIEQTRAKDEVDNSFTLLHYAAKEGQEECLRFLLSYLSQAMDISDISDSNGITPAHLAASEGHLECLQTLVDFKSDVTLKDREGFSPADRAFKAAQTGCGRYLVVVETCTDLSARLASCRKENEDLRNRLKVMESCSHMPERPEAVGGDQSDSSSTISMDSVIYTRRSSSAPDGESPKATEKEGPTACEYQDNGYLAPKPAVQSRHRTNERRGSITCFAHEDDSKQENNYLKSDGSQSCGKSPLNCSTISMTTNAAHTRVHYEDLRSQYSAQEATRKSPLPVVSNSVNSSRSQSPCRSDRSRTSSTETVLEATPLEQHHSVDRGRSNGEMTNHRQLYAVSNRPRSSSERPFSSENDVNYKPRIVYEMTNHAKTPKENQKNIRTQNYLSSNELLQTPNSSNQRARLSWHGPDKVATPQHSAHVTMRNSSRSDDRQARVIWGDQKRRVTIGGVILPGNTFERAITHPQHPKNYKTETQDNIPTSYASSFSNADERPWYETEEVEL